MRKNPHILEVSDFIEICEYGFSDALNRIITQKSTLF